MSKIRFESPILFPKKLVTLHLQVDSAKSNAILAQRNFKEYYFLFQNKKTKFANDLADPRVGGLLHQ